MYDTEQLAAEAAAREAARTRRAHAVLRLSDAGAAARAANGQGDFHAAPVDFLPAFLARGATELARVDPPAASPDVSA